MIYSHLLRSIRLRKPFIVAFFIINFLKCQLVVNSTHKKTPISFKAMVMLKIFIINLENLQLNAIGH